MKTRLTILIFLFTSFMYIGSSAQSYYYMQSTGTETAYSYTTLGDTFNGWAAGMPDTLVKSKSLPFSWNFYGEAITSFRVSDNGYVTFDATATKSIPDNESLPSVTAPKKAIFAFWDNLVLYKPDAYSYLIHTWTYGTAPNRVFVIAWFQASKEPAKSTDSKFTFAIRLFESGAKSFDIVYDNYYLKSGGVAATTSGTVGCQNGDGTVGTMVTGSPNVTFPTNITSATTDNVVYEFYYGTQLGYDLAGSVLNVSPYAKTGTSVPISGSLRNWGSQTITSLKLNYTIDGGATVSQTISSVNITPGATYNFVHGTNWSVPTTEKDYTLVVWASDLNGNADENTSNDNLTMTIAVISNFVERKPLHEVFTSSTCPPCKPGNEVLDGVLNNYPNKWTCVKYQYNFPGTGDPYFTSECSARGSFYGGINSVPRLEVDGAWNGNPGGYNTGFFDQFYAVPCFVNITAEAVFTGQSVTVTGTATSYANISGTVKLYMAVVEKKTTQNIKSNGETEFHYVMKKMLPSANGSIVSPVAKNTPIEINQSYTFPGSYKLAPNATSPINLLTEHSVEEFTDLAVVIWLQNTTTKEVYQSAFAKNPNSIEEPGNNFQVSLYPNPVSTTGQVRFSLNNPTSVSYEIINSMGQTVYSNAPSTMPAGVQTLDFDASTLSNGVYFMKLNVGGQSISRTFLK